MTNGSPLSTRVIVLMTLPPLLWAGNAVVGRLLVGSVPPMTLNFIRWLLAAALLAPLGWRALRGPRDRRAIAAAWPYLLAIGTCGVGAYNALQYLALETSTALNVTLIAASMPVWMLAIGALFFSERPTTRQIAGAALSLAGVLMVVSRGQWAVLARVQFVPGDGYILLAVMMWALYSWLLVRPPAAMRAPQRPDWDWAAFLFVQTLFGLIAAGAAAAGEAAFVHPPAIDWHNGWILAALAYVAIGPSIIAYRCWGLGLAIGGPALAAFFANLTPLFAALLSALLLGEAPQAYHAAAFALIVAGIAVTVRRVR